MNKHLVVMGLGIVSLFASSGVHASCQPIGSEEGSRVSTLVSEGSARVVEQIEAGFTGVQEAVVESNAKQSQQIVSALEGFTQSVVAEIRQLPKTQAEIDRRRNELDPTRQMTNPCGAIAIAADKSQVDDVSREQEASLNEAGNTYNSSNVSSRLADSRGMFKRALYRSIKDRPNVHAAPARLATGNSLKEGAISNEELQDAAFVTFVTSNPEPPSQIASPVGPNEIAFNVDSFIYNMRISMAQAVQNQIISYETPSLEVQEDSSYWPILQNMGIVSEDDSDTITLSKRQVMELDATKRVKDPTFIAMLNGKDVSGALKDLALAKSELMAQEFEGWKQDRNTVVLLSQLLAAKLRSQE